VVDLRERFAYPLPVGLLADLLGAPVQVTRSVIDTTGGAARDAMAEVVAAKRRAPGDDVISDLITDDCPALIDTIFAILRAGSTTLINFFDHAVTALLSHPDQLDLVTSGRRSWDDVVDETLRVQSPIAYLPTRYAAEDIELDDVTIPEGDRILLNCAAHGRDPALHGETATEFDVSREDKRHVSFGHGPHHCPAVELARLVATTGLAVLFDRFPDASLVVPVAQLLPLPTFTMNGHRALPVRLTTLATSNAWAA
jgi:cytochrome P450